MSSNAPDAGEPASDPSPTRARRVAVVGAGAIGLPMVRRLVAAGHDVVAVEPFDPARARVAEVGGTAVDDVSACQDREITLVVVATGEQLLEVSRSAARSDLTGQTWVVVSTVGPADCRAAGRALADAGAAVVDAPVTGGVTGAESGRLRFFAAGHETAVAGLADVLSVLGQVVPVGAEIGGGQSMKLVNQLCSSTHLVIAAEAVAFATALGVDPATAVRVISGGSGSSWFLDDRGPRMALGAPETLTRLAILAKDSALVESEAEAADAFVPMLKAARERYREAESLGLLEQDDSQVVQAYLSHIADADGPGPRA